jgi:leader peptidase (prepilin peptidase) / N-methyltransferase
MGNLSLGDITWVVLSGLAVGSFLNVLIARLPLMLERRWQHEALETAIQMGHAGPDVQLPPIGLNLWVPGSHCPRCQSPIPWHLNVPLLSFLMLRGQCRHCAQAISWRYPLVEILSAAWFLAMALTWGLGITAACWALFGAALIALTFIDVGHMLLPNELTQPLCWAGLLASAAGWIRVDLPSALWGAVVGYLLLWSVAQIYGLIKKQQGMGQGDFKLLAALGAWLGWQNLGLLVLMASILGIVHGVSHKIRHPQADPHFPFGPSLCLAAALLALAGRGMAWTWF